MAGLIRGQEPASEEFLARVMKKKRTIGYAKAGSDDLRYLDYRSASANVGGPMMTHILLREDPRKIEVWEEFLHGTQFCCKIIDRIGIEQAEVHVKQFMIRHQRLLGISKEDVKVIEQLLGD